MERFDFSEGAIAKMAAIKVMPPQMNPTKKIAAFFLFIRIPPLVDWKGSPVVHSKK